MALILLVGVIPSSVDADDERQTRKKIVFWNLFTGGSSHEVVTERVAHFNHRQQEYVVEQVDVPGGHITAKILPAVAGGVPPDLTIFDRFMVASYAARGAFMSLDDFADRDGIRGEDFFQAQSVGQAEGRPRFALPGAHVPCHH